MVRITSTMLFTLVMTTLLSAQSPYVPYAHHQLHGPGLRRVVPADYRPAVLRTIADHYDVHGHSYPTRLVADRYLINQPPETYGRGSCGNAALHNYPGYSASKRDRNTQRVLYDRDKYVKNNIYGDDTIFDRGQPLRNIFRYIFP